VTIDGLGRVQLFVSKEQAQEAHQILDEYNRSKGEHEGFSDPHDE
jgi:hypothetical protein